MKTALFSGKEIFLQILIVGVLVLLLGSTNLLYPFGVDQGNYAYVGYAYLKGKIIYKDVFEVKPPLTHLVHALALRLFGHSMLSIRLLDLLWQWATAAVILFITTLFFKRRGMGILAAFLYIFFYFSLDGRSSAQTDGFLTLPLSLSILMFLIAKEKERPTLLILSGLFLGIAVLFKYPIGIFLVFLLLIILLRAKNLNRPAYVPALCLLVGFCATMAMFLISLIASHSLSDFFSIQYNYITNYSYGLPNIRLHYPIRLYHMAFAFFSLLVLFEIVYIIRRKLSIDSFLIALWWLAALVHLVAQNKYFIYHHLPILAPLAIIASHVIFSLYETSLKYSSWIQIPALGLAVSLIVLGYVNLGYLEKHKVLFEVVSGQRDLRSVYKSRRFGTHVEGNFSIKNDLEVADYLKKHSDVNDKIFVWGFEPAVYFLSERECASRYIMNFVLYGNFPWKHQEEFVRELERNEPKYILIVKNDAIYFITSTHDDSQAAFKKFPAFYNFVQEKYEKREVIEDFIIYKRNS